MSNASDHVPITRDPSKEIFVRAHDDLGPEVLAPDGVMRRKIEVDRAYTFQVSMTLPRLWIQPTADPTIAITLRGSRAVKLMCDGSDIPHIWGRDIGIITLDLLQFVDVSNGNAGHGTRLFDLVGVSAFSFFVIRASTWLNFKFMGTLTDVSKIQNGPTEVFRALAGYVIRSTPGFNNNTIINATRVENLASDPDMVGAALTFIGGPPSVILIGMFFLQGKPANSFIHIDSGSDGNYNINGNHYLEGPGLGTFFRPDEVQSLTQQANVSILTSLVGFSDSTANPGVDTTVNFDAIVDVKRGDIVLLEDEIAYDATHTVVRVSADLLSFDINVVFSTSGQGTMAIVEHTVATGVRFVEGETVAVTATTNYNAAIQILRKTSDTTFTLPQSFNGDDATGTATSIGKTQKSLGVFCRANAAQPDSLTIGGYTLNANATMTIIAAPDVYQAIDATGAVAVTNEQRFTLVDAVAGVLRYDGLAPFSGTVTAILKAFKGGANAEYRSTISINGAIPAPAVTPYATAFVKSGLEEATLRFPVDLVKNDTIQAMTRGVGTADNLTYQEIVLTTEM